MPTTICLGGGGVGVAGFFFGRFGQTFFLKGLAKPCFVHFLRFSWENLIFLAYWTVFVPFSLGFR